MAIACAAVRWAVVPLLVLAACGSGGGAAVGTTSTTAPASSETTASETTASSETTTAVPGRDGPVIVVDPGHNGANGAHPEIINRPVDAGGFQKACNTTGAATDDGVTESSINWAVAQLLRDRLESEGARVILTRDSDDGVGPCIDERGRAAAEAHADLLVSVHADGAPAGAHGFHVIHPALRPGYTDDTVGPSAELASAVRDALVADGFTPSTYIGEDGLDERDDLGTLNLAGVPAVMVEAGNLRNTGDAGTLTSAGGQARLAAALASGVLTFAG
jgi:N-acetylmuramoyl-L-alanine amidase